MAIKNKKTLDDLCTEINKTYKEVIAGKNLKQPVVSRIPFTSPRANYITYGGLPRGRFVEFLGEENGGKTTTALDIVGQAQKLFYEEWEASPDEGATLQRVVYIDVETTLDEEWAQLFGVDIETLYLLRPISQSAEDIFDIALAMIETREVGLIVIDSLAAMVSSQEVTKDVGEASYGGISKALTLFCRKAAGLCNLLNCTILGINQLRDDLKNPHAIYKTPGGRAWKFYCSVRLEFRKGDFLDETGDSIKRSSEAPAGNKVEMVLVKTKCFPPNRRLGFYTLSYTRGVDVILDMVDTALKTGIIKQKGAWIEFVDIETGEVLTEDDGSPIKVQGRLNVSNFLANDEFVFNFVKDQVDKMLQYERD